MMEFIDQASEYCMSLKGKGLRAAVSAGAWVKNAARRQLLTRAWFTSAPAARKRERELHVGIFG
jgi:hypothetical protein